MQCAQGVSVPHGRSEGTDHPRGYNQAQRVGGRLMPVRWTLTTTAFFDRRARKFLARHPDPRPRFAEVLTQLEDDPFQPGLRLHPLSGRLEGQQAVRLTYSYRITLTLQISGHEILLIDIGSHDEVYA